MDFYTFGLSLDPHAVHQRHVLYDDSDEENDAESLPLDPLLQITPKWNSPDVRLLLCAVGDAAAIFVKTHILPTDLIPVAHMTSSQTDRVFERTYRTLPDSKQKLSELYVHKDVAVCLHVKTLKQQFTTLWAQTAISAIKPKEVVVLTTANLYTYITDDPGVVTLPHVRYLHTTQFKQAVETPLLEPPNFISGEAAALITHCEIQSLPAYLQIHYNKKLDISTVQSFKCSPLQALGIEVRQASEESVKKMLPKETASMLYT